MKAIRLGTQKREILDHLNTNGNISGLEAVLTYYIMDLAGVIRNLKEDLGITIASIPIKKTNRNGRNVSFVRYTLDKTDENMLLVETALGLKNANN